MRLKTRLLSTESGNCFASHKAADTHTSLTTLGPCTACLPALQSLAAQPEEDTTSPWRSAVPTGVATPIFVL